MGLLMETAAFLEGFRTIAADTPLLHALVPRIDPGRFARIAFLHPAPPQGFEALQRILHESVLADKGPSYPVVTDRAMFEALVEVCELEAVSTAHPAHSPLLAEVIRMHMLPDGCLDGFELPRCVDRLIRLESELLLPGLQFVAWHALNRFLPAARKVRDVGVSVLSPFEYFAALSVLLAAIFRKAAVQLESELRSNETCAIDDWRGAWCQAVVDSKGSALEAMMRMEQYFPQQKRG